MTRQLPLPFTESPSYQPEDFLAAPCNQLARSWLETPENWTSGRMVLWGAPGCGKSFLLHLWARQAGALIYQGGALRGLPESPSSPLAIDDADAVQDETALLHLLNAAAEAGQPVLLTARLPPARQACKLPDLASRLRASLAVEITPPDDELLSALLFRLAAARQLRLTPALAGFLLLRLPRTPAVLREAIARLDRAALAAGGRITRQLAAITLRDLLTPQEVLTQHSPEDRELL
jgi:chromosomal replication initiation ATPase DnaA